MRAELRAELAAVLKIQGAFKERAHDAGLNELPVGKARFRELPQLIFGEFKNRGFLEQMAVEMADFVFAEWAPFGHDFEKLFECFGKVMKIVHAGLEHLAEKLPWQQAGVFGEETEHDAIQEAGDAEVFALRETHFRAGLRISQLDGF